MKSLGTRERRGRGRGAEGEGESCAVVKGERREIVRGRESGECGVRGKGRGDVSVERGGDVRSEGS